MVKEYDISIVKITNRGCSLVHTQTIKTENPIQLGTFYNKKLKCFITKQIKE